MSMKEVQSVLKKTSFKESASTRKATSGMVERHLSKQRTAYDQWIAELCNDCENSAAERDRLREKLSTLRNDHKRKVMAKVIGRLGHMQIFMAWQAWYNATVKYESQKKELKLKELKKALKESVWPRGIEFSPTNRVATWIWTWERRDAANVRGRRFVEDRRPPLGTSRKSPSSKPRPRSAPTPRRR